MLSCTESWSETMTENNKDKFLDVQQNTKPPKGGAPAAVIGSVGASSRGITELGECARSRTETTEPGK